VTGGEYRMINPDDDPRVRTPRRKQITQSRSLPPGLIRLRLTWHAVAGLGLGILAMIPLEITKELVQQFILWPLGLGHGLRTDREVDQADVNFLTLICLLLALFICMNLRSRTARSVAAPGSGRSP
jgi:hypothetical protein